MAVCFLTPIYTSSEKRPLISDHIKGPLVAAFRSPPMRALDRSVETLGLWIVTSSVTFIVVDFDVNIIVIIGLFPPYKASWSIHKPYECDRFLNYFTIAIDPPSILWITDDNPSHVFWIFFFSSQSHLKCFEVQYEVKPIKVMNQRSIQTAVKSHQKSDREKTDLKFPPIAVVKEKDFLASNCFP